MTKAQKFIALFRYWSGKLGLPYDIDIRKDNRYECKVACIVDDKEELLYMVYNAHKIAKWSDAQILCGMFHEIGHILNKLPYKTNEEKYKSELKAERYALKMMDKYYPKLAKQNKQETLDKLHNPRFIKDLEKHHTPLLKSLRKLYEVSK